MKEPQQQPPRKSKKVAGPDSDENTDDNDNASGGGKTKIILMAVALSALMLGVGAGAGFYVAGTLSQEQAQAVNEGEEEIEDSFEEDEEDDRHRIYASVGKLLATVEYQGSTRYIQAEVDLVGYDKDLMAKATHDMPAIRNQLLLLFSSQAFDEVKTVAGREALRAASIKAVNEVLRKKPKQGIADAYFTSFVTQ